MQEATHDLRRITLRVPPQLHRALTQAAEQRNTSLNYLAVQALEEYTRQEGQRLPLKELSQLLAPTAEAAEIDEETFMRHIKETRRRIWQERYQQSGEQE